MSDLQRYYQEKWDAEGATQALYYTHALTPDSIVFDVGGYLGEWSEVIARTYNPHIFIFEPVLEFVSQLKERFAGNKKVKIFPYGLASRKTRALIYKRGPATSLYQTSSSIEDIELRDIPTAVCDVLGVESVGYARIDLVSINTEGGEYDLFDSIFQSGLAHRMKEIIVQFHPIGVESYDRWIRARNALLTTHDELWGYPFVWEKWKVRDWQL